MTKRTQIGGKELYEKDRAAMFANPELVAVYRAEGAKKALWLQLIEARQAARLSQQQLARRLGVSQSRVARLEKQGYDGYTLTSLRRYVDALGRNYVLEVRVRRMDEAPSPSNYRTL